MSATKSRGRPRKKNEDVPIKKCSKEYYQKMRNITLVVDYVQFFYLLAFADVMINKIVGSINALSVTLIFANNLICICLVREMFMAKRFPEAISDFKMQRMSDEKIWRAIRANAQTGILAMAALVPLTWIDIDGTPLLVWTNVWSPTAMFWIWFDFVAISVIKDMVSMWPLHMWFHGELEIAKKITGNPRSSGYAHHKQHHEALLDVQAWNAVDIGFMDLLAENTFGPTIFLGVNYLLGFHCHLHLFSYMVSGIGDTMLHSMNPYSAYFHFLPLDRMVLANLCHQCHHGLNKGYYTFIPYNHIFGPSPRLQDTTKKQDIAQYNSIMKTGFIF